MEQSNLFETDSFSGKPKILFIGLAESSHTHSWIDLLSETEFNVRLFAMPTGGVPPANWKVRTYLSVPLYPEGLAPHVRKCLHPTVEERQKAEEERQKAEEERQKAEEERQKAEQRNPFLRLKRYFLEGFIVQPTHEGIITTLKKWLLLSVSLPLTLIFRL